MKDELLEQIKNITKAHAYDILAKQLNELEQEKEVYKKALNTILDEIIALEPKEIIDNPGTLLIRIGSICNTALKQKP